MVARSAERGFGATRALTMLSLEKHKPFVVKLASASFEKRRRQDMDYAPCSTGEYSMPTGVKSALRSGDDLRSVAGPLS